MNVHLFFLFLSFGSPWGKKIELSNLDSTAVFKRFSGMIQKKADGKYIVPLPGIEQKTLVYGKNTLMTKFKLKKGAEIPPHRHPHEQTGYLVSGRIRMCIDADVHELEAGDAWCIPGGVEHGADAVEDAVAVEAFSPVREDYIPAK